MSSLRPLASRTFTSPARPRPTSRRPRRRPTVEALERRTVLSVSVLNNSGNGYAALSFNQSGGYVPPDTNGAAGPSAYVETVNQEVALYTNKATGAGAVTDSLGHFLFTTGGLARADRGSGQSDPIVTYDESIGRFIIGDQDVDFSTHVSAFDLAVSRTSNPTTLSASDWTFYRITTTQTGEDADYPGNFGYNADAFVFTLNMFPVSGTSGTYHAQVVSVNASDLANAASSPHVYQNNLNDFSVRPTTMHGAQPGDPMWLVTEHGDNQSIDVIKMTNVLTTSPTFAYTNLAVAPYSATVSPKNPNGTTITTNIDSRIDKAAEANNTIVAAHSVGVSSTEDDVQWYAVDVSGGTPKLAQQGRVSAGNNTYLTYPGIDINSSGSIGMSYIRQGTDSSTDYMSMYVTGRASTDAAGTMEAPVLVPAGKGQANYTDFASPHREGDLSGINVDPSNGTFWAANEFANTQSTANWGTAVANFQPSAPTNSADVIVTMTGPSSVTAGSQATYTITVTNNGPSPAAGVVLTDTLPAGSTFGSMNQTGGSDTFTRSTSTDPVTETASGNIASGSTDTFTLVVTAPSSPAGTNFSNTASVTGTTADPNSANNTATVAGQIAGPAADLAVSVSGPGSGNEGDTLTYTVTVTNNDAANPGTGVVLTATLPSILNYVSATSTAGTVSQSGGTVTVDIPTLGPTATATLTLVAQANEDGSANVSGTVTASSSDPTPSNNSATATTSVGEPPIVVSAPISTSSKNVSNLDVATFTHDPGIEPPSAFTATIDWGDNTTSAGTITESNGTYSVVGSHHYRRGGSHTITTTVSEVSAAAQLLDAKIGDESPDLPPQINGDGHGRDLAALADGFAGLVDAFLSQAPGVTLADLQTSLTVVLDAGAAQGVAAPLSTLVASLGSRHTSNPRAVAALLLIDDLGAQHDG